MALILLSGHSTPNGSETSKARLFTKVAIFGLLLGILIALLLGWLSREVIEGDTVLFDASVRAAVHAEASPPLTAIMRFFTDLGSPPALALLLAGALVLFWRARWKRAALVTAIAMTGAGALMEALKLGFHRLRPVPFFGLAAPHSFSFPSGHALLSFTFFGTIAALVDARVSSRWAKVGIWVAAAVIIACIGFSRIYLGVHYPTDVIAGYMTAFVWVTAMSWADRIYSFRRFRQ